MNFIRLKFELTRVLFTLTVICISGCATVTEKPVEEKRDSSEEVQAVSLGAKKIQVLSWNIKHLGRASLNYEAAAKVLEHGEVIALQEVNKSNGKAALEKLGKIFEEKIGEKTCEAITEATDGPGAEKYAFIWINSRVSLVSKNGQIVPNCPESALPIELNKSHHSKIDREPAQATFQLKGTKSRFTILSVHLVPTAKSPAKEVPWLFDSTEGIIGAVIVVGDFNLAASHPAFKKAADVGFFSALKSVPTSLKMNIRALNEAYDNIWIRGAKFTNAFVVDLYKAFPNEGQKSIYNNISDHSAVVAEIDLP